jgi:transposase
VERKEAATSPTPGLDRELLERMLGEGLSLATIGRRVGRHEATVGYWLKRYGRRAAQAERHLARGALDRDDLRRLVEEGLSTGQIATRLDRSKTTIRHWLREYGLATQRAQRRVASAAGELRVVATCRLHGTVEFARRSGGGFRCTRCRADAVTRRRRKVKRQLVEEAGGRCSRCGYERCIAALEFHHLEPAEKRFSLSHRGVTRSIERARAEAAKCVLLCANCHAELEASVAQSRGSRIDP